MYQASLLLLYLGCYSFLGWVAEVLYVFVTTRHLQNRGFLTGPFLPIYGVGALALLVLVAPYVDNPFLVFAASVLITSALEYTTHLVLDRVFHIKLWDYSGQRFNLHGRICLQNSLAFGALGLLLLYVIHPAVDDLAGALPPEVAIAVAWALFGVILVDSANSVRSLSKVRPVLDRLEGTLGQAHAAIEADAGRHRDPSDARATIAHEVHLRTLRRLGRAFPHARSAHAAPAHPASAHPGTTIPAKETSP